MLEKFLDDDSDMHRLHLTAEQMSRQYSVEDSRKRSLARHSRPQAQAPHEEAADRQGLEGEGEEVGYPFEWSCFKYHN